MCLQSRRWSKDAEDRDMQAQPRALPAHTLVLSVFYCQWTALLGVCSYNGGQKMQRKMKCKLSQEPCLHTLSVLPVFDCQLTAVLGVCSYYDGHKSAEAKDMQAQRRTLSAYEAEFETYANTLMVDNNPKGSQASCFLAFSFLPFFAHSLFICSFAMHASQP